MPLSQPRCLACEDQALIGLALERDLEDAGFDIVGPFTSVAAALAWVETSTPDLAVLDYKLQDGSCTALVGVLRERGVPVVIHSGWQRQDADLPGELAEVPWLEKPCDRPALLAALVGVAPSVALATLA